MKPLELIAVAKLCLRHAGEGKPSQVLLRQATSAAYYAVFHCLARDGADLLIGGINARRSEQAWLQTYRALEHGYARSQCSNRDVVARFPKSIEDFAIVFVKLQAKRHRADYDPRERFTKLGVQEDIALAEAAIRAFRTERVSDRRAFCAWVLFKVPRS